MTVEERNQHILENKIISTKKPDSKSFKDLTGKTFNGIKVIKYVGRDKDGKSYYECKCTCGNIFIKDGSSIKTKNVLSCGCKHKIHVPKIDNTSYPNSKQFKDLSGKIFNGIELLECVGKNKNMKMHYKCKCRCGNIFIAARYKITSNRKLSCGCIKYGKSPKCNNTHKSKDPIYSIYNEVIHSKNVYKEWSEGQYCFETFRDWMLSQGFVKSMNILRKDPNKEYSPDNCILVSSELTKKFKSDNHYLTIGNYTYPMSIWSVITGIKYGTISNRILRGWSDEDAALTPVRGRRGIDVIDFTIPAELEKFNGCGQ